LVGARFQLAYGNYVKGANLSPPSFSGARRGALEKDNRQGGQSDGQGKRPAVSGNSDGLDAAQVAPAAAAIISGVAVEQLLPVTSAGDTHSIVRSRHRGEVAKDQDHFVHRLTFPQKAQRA